MCADAAWSAKRRQAMSDTDWRDLCGRRAISQRRWTKSRLRYMLAVGALDLPQSTAMDTVRTYEETSDEEAPGAPSYRAGDDDPDGDSDVHGESGRAVLRLAARRPCDRVGRQHDAPQHQTDQGAAAGTGRELPTRPSG